jgi:hypothetical protein
VRRASDGALAGRDRKAGFCLGDRFVTALPVDEKLVPADPVSRTRAGSPRPA